MRRLINPLQQGADISTIGAFSFYTRAGFSLFCLLQFVSPFAMDLYNQQKQFTPFPVSAKTVV